MRLSELLQALGVEANGVREDVEVGGVAADSRRVRPGDVFFALPGVHTDGRRHIAEALGRGARAVITTGEVDAGGAPVVRVDAPHRLLGRAAARVAGDPIALQALLAEMRAAGTTHVAMEVSSHALAQDRVAGCRFDAGVFTNLTRDHLDFHGDLEAYYGAKARLFHDVLPAGGKRDPVAVVNVDDPAGERLAASVRTHLVRVGRSPRAAVRPLAVETTLAGMRGTLDVGG